MDIGQNFPISEFYREHILDARTLSRAGSWWSAALLIRDPRSGQAFIGIYKWQKVGDTWKTRSKINIRSTKEISALEAAFSEMKHILDD